MSVSTPLGRRVLFVDDEAIICKQVTRFLDKLGCSGGSLVLKGGDDPQQMLKDIENVGGFSAFDIIFLDIVMPKMSGEVLCEKIRAMDKNIPVVAATSNTSTQDRNRYHDIGFTECLQKPYSLSDFQRAIRSLSVT
jgi:CheY-like chemotaxis protein